MNASTELKNKYSIKLIVSSMFMLVAALTAIFAMSMQYYFGQKMSQEHVILKLSTAAADVSEYIRQVDNNTISSTRMLKSFLSTSDRDFSEKQLLTLFAQALDENPFILSLYVGSENENFFQIINLKNSEAIRNKMSAEDADCWAIAKVTGRGSDRKMSVSYVDSNFNVNRTIVNKTSFYPTRRPWFIGATETKVHKTEPYLFKNMKVTGQSYSIRNGEDVIGIDIELSTLNSKVMLTALGMGLESGVESFIFNHKGEVIASNIDLAHDVLMPSSEPLMLTESQRALVTNAPALLVSNQNDKGPYDFSQAGEPQGYAVELLRIAFHKAGLEFDFINGFESDALSKKYLRGSVDVLHSVSGEVSEYGKQSALMYTSALAIAGKSDGFIPASLENFTGKVGVVCGFGMKGWLQKNYPQLDIVEFESLSDAKEALEKDEVLYLVDTYRSLYELKSWEKTSAVTVRKLDAKPVPYYMYMNRKHAGLLEVLNLAIESITPEQREALKYKWLESTDWRGTFVPYPEVFLLAKDISSHNKMVRKNIKGQEYFIYVTPILSTNDNNDYFSVVIPQEMITDAVTKRLFNSLLLTALVMLALFPLAWQLGTPITRSIYALKASARKVRARRLDKVLPMRTRIKEVDELSEAMMEMLAQIQSHEKQQEEFIEAFIRLIAQAIDDKSPYTAGHCNRVPEIGLMLAEAVEKCDTGKFKDFKFNNEDERREFRIAAWLHDCGKITTPEHIVDKGTKLEANYNRINEIRTRFEVLRRDAEVEMWKSISTGELSKEEAQAKFDQRVAQLDEEFRFVANANVGGEFMSDEKIERIKQIAQQTWLRHYDDHLGLSPFEEMIKPKSDVTLPVVENLLADKPDHIIERARPIEFDPEYGIKMQVPEHQYNLGEVYNLTISRGTLTPEDRFKINEHMISGIKMLEALPFPPELSRVPRYASTHHETLKGTGYPRRLNADDLSIPERILVIADVFEALTAADRPYKKVNPVSVAVDIMHNMALNDHIDMDLFLLFLESGVYRDYANKFMSAEQVDEVDIEKYLKSKSSDA